MADCYTNLAKLVKDNKFELIQIKNIDKDSNKERDATLYYLKKSILVHEALSGVEHPLVGEAYLKIGLRLRELKNYKKSLIYLRKAFVIFYSTIGSKDEITVRCYGYLKRVENNMATRYYNYGLDQLAIALMDNYAQDLDDDSDEDEDEDDEGGNGLGVNRDDEEEKMALMYDHYSKFDGKKAARTTGRGGDYGIRMIGY